MKKLLLIIPLFLFACDSSTTENNSDTIKVVVASTGNVGAALLEKRPAVNPDYVHWELMSAQAERRIGNKSYIFILPLTYKTDNSAQVCTTNLQHSADVLNHTADTLRSIYPYIAYSWETEYGGVNRESSWTYVSPRLHPASEIPNIKKWMIEKARAYHAPGIKIDSSKNPACILKIAWQAPELKSK